MTPVQDLGALILFTSQLERVVAFYRALGVPLAEERHDEGPVHHACDLGRVHLAVFEGEPGVAPPRGHGGCTFPGFTVESVAEALDDVRALGATVLAEPAMFPWGLRAVVVDPDGRPVEIFERSGA